jgi:GxxExxY protein
MCIELNCRNIRFERQVRVPAYYKGHLLGEYRVDLIVRHRVVVEIKSVSE